MAANNFRFSNKAWFIIVVAGILYLISIYMIATKSDYDATAHDMRSTISYVKSQYTEFKKLNVASEVKSLTKAADKAVQLARDVEREKAALSPKLLERYAAEQRLSGIMLLDEKGKLVCEYAGDRFGYAGLRYELEKPSVLDIANSGQKVYMNRIELNDGSYIDLSAVRREDEKGVVVVYYHTSSEYAHNYNMSVQTLFAGYSMQTTGTIVITDGEKIVASNDAALINTKAVNNTIVQELKRSGEMGELTHVYNEYNESYYGSVDHGREYYIYVYFPDEKVFTTRWQKMGYALVLYFVIIGIFYGFRSRTEELYLAKQRELDEEYKEQLREAARVAKNANQAKTEFLQRMSHDIRTPINGIRGLVEIGNYYKGDLTKQTECREKIWQTSGFLLDLINEVLDMGKLSSGEVTLEEIPFDLRELRSEVVNIVAQQAKEKGVEIIVKKEELQHPCLIGSPVHVKRILLNILGNAVKYNKENGKVYLSRTELSCENDVALIEFKCEDTGIGISKRFLPHVFEAFAQDGDVARSSYEGSGLGMPIVKSLVEKMGGTVEVESEQGIGSIFTVRIPFKIDKQMQAEKAKREELDINAARGMHVLLAEDNDLNMEIAKFFLDNAGVTYTLAKNGKEAVELFEASKPNAFDAILMDVMMPFMNGLEATQKIRELKRDDAQTVPIIAMTANAFVEDKRRAFEAGMTEYITKPLQSDVLIKKLAQFAKKK